MNQPTREEFEQLKKEVRQLREQITEPIKVTRIEVASEDVIKRFELMDQKLDRIDQRQNEHANGLIMHSRNINVLQEEMKGARADILSIKATLSDHGELLKNTASKDDLKKLETRFEARIDRLESTQTEHSQLLREILNRLPAKQ